jgi:hypothetical protein
MATPETDTDRQQEIARLQARVEQLEQELLDQAQRTNKIVAEAQERAYWLDRWHLDLNALMRKPGAAQFRAALRGARKVVRRLKAYKQRFTPGS